MKFSKIVFTVAGVWGIVVLTPLFWLYDITGRRYETPTEYPHFFYGFVAVAMAWQIAFLIIGSNPVRFRPLMIPSMLEKFAHVTNLVVLESLSRISVTDFQAALPDCVLGLLFVAAFVKTPRSGPTP